MEKNKKIGKSVRPIFIPKKNDIGVIEQNVSFDWHMGMSAVVKQRSIFSLHEKAKEKGFYHILEASSKSQQEIGIQLSAFFLKDDKGFPVENLFQSSKVFDGGKQFIELKFVSPREAKQDWRIRNCGDMLKFSFENRDFPLEPKSLFYDWLYIKTLFTSNCNLDLREAFIAEDFDAFTDIEFNPKRSFSCQARTLALAVSLYKNESIPDFLNDPENFVKTFPLYGMATSKPTTEPSQGSLF